MHKVSLLTYRMKIGGPGHACPLFDLYLDDAAGQQFNNIDLINLLRESSDSVGDKSHVVQMYMNPALTNEDEIRELIMGLKDNGFSVIGNVVGSYIPTYIKEFNSVIANLTEPKWINFQANEIHYYPQEYPIIEPDLSPVNIKAFKYVMIAERRKAKEVFTFLQTASTLWGIMGPQTRTYEIEVIKA